MYDYVCSGIVIFGWLLFALYKLVTRQAKKKRSPQPEACPGPPSFSPSAYLGRISKVCEDLWREPKERYTLILWWGLDGLKLNRDGAMQWISKTVVRPEYATDCRYSDSGLFLPFQDDISILRRGNISETSLANPLNSWVQNLMRIEMSQNTNQAIINQIVACPSSCESFMLWQENGKER